LCFNQDFYGTGVPENRRSGIILPTENNSHHVLLVGRVREIPPTGADEFLSYARELPTPTIYTAIKNAKRLTDITPFPFRKVDSDISRRSLTFLVGCFPLGMQFVVLIQFTAKG
jgi:hypothetical protein